jgi:RNA polymerase sigma-32 factor
MSSVNALAIRPQSLPTPLGGSLEAYIRTVNSLPVLDAEQERRLARQLRDHGDLQAAQQLVLANLRHVVHIARGYLGYGLQLADLIQEGNIGLMKAVKRFDPEVGVRLISFAVHWIRAEIHEFILRNWRIVRVATTKAQRKLFFNLRSAKKRLGWMNQGEVEAVAADLKVKPETVLEMEDRLSGHDVSFNALPAEGEHEDSAFGPEHYLAADEAYNPEHQLGEREHAEHQLGQLQSALRTLDDRSRDILRRRWLDESRKSGLQELADEYGISAERVRQIEAAALKKLRGAFATA